MHKSIVCILLSQKNPLDIRRAGRFFAQYEAIKEITQNTYSGTSHKKRPTLNQAPTNRDTSDVYLNYR